METPTGTTHEDETQPGTSEGPSRYQPPTLTSLGLAQAALATTLSFHI